MDELRYIHFLKSIKGLGEIKIKRLVSRCRDFESLNQFIDERFPLRELLGPVSAQQIEVASINNKLWSNNFDILKSQLDSKKINYTTIISDDYPKNLKHITDPPAILYYKGNLISEDRFSIGIVGTRSPSVYGREVCEKIAGDISRLGIPVISGMAIGIDAISHKSAIKNYNQTYAVLGSGVDVIYPQSNSNLYDNIIANGAVLSEYEPGTEPDKNKFPGRNRIISGISLGVLIVESALKGGSLITANFALDQNREVFAIPGNINSNTSRGTNNLIKRGMAKPVTEVDDILVELEYKLAPVLKKDDFKRQEKVIKSLNAKENKLYEVINNEPVNIDLISELSGFNITDCLVNLLSLEFKGVIKQLPGKNFIRIC